LLEFENKYYSKGKRLIAGIDEVGRGPLCGPVVAASVILPIDVNIPEITDSKKLSVKKRNTLYQQIKKHALYIGLGIVHEDKIDELNILQATMQAMRESIEDLGIKPDMLLVDGNIKPLSSIPQESIIKGDSKSLSIAAASIIAKVTRDNMMAQYDMIYPGYGLSRNMGYGTREHMEAIKRKFSTPIHRRSFNPVNQYMPRFKDVKDTQRLSAQIVASDLLKRGHEILMVHSNFDRLDILTLFRGKTHAYSLSDEAKRQTIKEQAKDAINQLDGKKDISSSLNISVISVEFSKEKPKINYTNL
jgi:ribonuclease HII